MSQTSHDPFLEAQRARLAGAMAEAARRREAQRAARRWLEPGFDFGPPIADSEWTPRHFMLIRPKPVVAAPKPQRRLSHAQIRAHARAQLRMQAARVDFSVQHPFGLTRLEHRLARALCAGYPGLTARDLLATSGVIRPSFYTKMTDLRRKLQPHGISILSSGTKPAFFWLSRDISLQLDQVQA